MQKNKKGVGPMVCRLVKGRGKTQLRTALTPKQNNDDVIALSIETIDFTEGYDREYIEEAFSKPVLKLADYPVMTVDLMCTLEEQTR